jgi:hypothetical protein
MTCTKTKFIIFRALALGALSAILAIASPARADFIGAIQIDFQSGDQSGSYAFVLPADRDPYAWALASPVNVYSDTNQLVGTIRSLDVMLNGDPGVSLGFFVTANAAPTHITVTSSTVTFGAISNPLAFATAGITVTDNDSDGANVTGLYPANLAYQANYNGSSVFANLVSPISAAIDSSTTISARSPSTGFSTIAGAVSSIQTQFDFMLSANDSASGTSRFTVVVPEPSSVVLALLGAAALAVVARRPRK